MTGHARAEIAEATPQGQREDPGRVQEISVSADTGSAPRLRVGARGDEGMAEVAIGIDLGTSNSCVAIANAEGAEVIPNAYGEGITASVVAFNDDGTILVGNAAKANVIHAPRTTIYSAKRLLGRYFFSEEVKKARAICSYEIVEGPNHGVRIKVRDEEYSLPEISAMILKEMKTIAESRIGQPVTKAVVTVPAYFNDNQRQATKDACRIAGLEPLRILNEPTAAALSYGFGKGLNQKVAVYDLGGGTFDISVLEIGKDVFEVLSTCGDTFLGGDDFDDRVIDLLADEFSAKHGIALRSDPYALEKLKVAAESAKKGLSVDDEVEIRIPDVAKGTDGQSLSLERRLGIREYAALVNDLILRTFKVCDEALQQAGIVTRDLAGVILVGGPTRLPLIRKAVSDYFQQEPRTDVNPDEVVAMGAALHAASLLAPEQQAFLLDVTPLSLRIGVAGGLAETVIERNTPVPIDQTRTFTTFQDFQESVRIRVYQGESRHAAENELLGEFVFGGFAKARRGEVKIEVTFEINSDGIVNVMARDPATGQKASTRITLSSGLSEEEIQRIIVRGRTDQVQTPSPSAVEPPPSVKLPIGAAAAAFAASVGGAPAPTASAAPMQPLVATPVEPVLAEAPSVTAPAPETPQDLSDFLESSDEVLGDAVLDITASRPSLAAQDVTVASDLGGAVLDADDLEILPETLPDTLPDTLPEVLPETLPDTLPELPAFGVGEDGIPLTAQAAAREGLEIELDPGEGESFEVISGDDAFFSEPGGDLSADPLHAGIDPAEETAPGTPDEE
jgi:molecular chaperone DnaK